MDVFVISKVTAHGNLLVDIGIKCKSHIKWKFKTFKHAYKKNIITFTIDKEKSSAYKLHILLINLK